MFIAAHIFLIALSNVLVQFPFQCFGLNTTYGAFTYPFIFILSDLNTRLYGKQAAFSVIFKAMLPALVISFVISSYSLWHVAMAEPFWLSFRVSVASFIAYVCGQLMDIHIFSSLRQRRPWYIAPTISSILSNTFDTFCFFAIAFYHSSHPFMREHWMDVASVDLFFKCLISLVAFVPIYGLILSRLQSRTLQGA